MIPEQNVELLCLRCVITDCEHDPVYEEWCNEHYDMDKLYKRYTELGKMFMSTYAKH